MSKFFQSKTYTEIDDVNYSYNTTWSSNRIATEVKNLKPKLKLGELVDVNTNNADDKYTITYSKTLNTWVATPISDIIGNVVGVGGGGCEVRQVTKLGVTGTSTTPEIITIPYTTVDFKIPRVNMLKFKDSEADLTTTEGEFNLSEQSDYVSNDFIIFDGKARLKTDYEKQMVCENILPNDKIWNEDMDKSLFKDIFDINVEGDVYPRVKYKAVPKDQILIQQKDYDLSSIVNVKTFELGATGKNIRIVCSVDEGTTWKYFDGVEFQDVLQLDIHTITQYGNTIDEFNLIKERWNYITSSKKIRFAYLLSMDNIDDEEYIDYIALRYTGNGVWLQAKDVDYDVEITNTELKVYCYITGDIKINYEKNRTEGGDNPMPTTQYSGTTSSGGVITTTEANQKIYFYDPHDLTSKVSIKNLYLESLTLFTFSFNDELSTHTLEGNGTAMEVDGFSISYLVIKEAGAQLKYEALI